MAAGLVVLAPRRRRVVERNLALCFPLASGQQRWRWTWQTFLHFSQSFLDRVWLWHGAEELVRERVRVHDPQGVLNSEGGVLFFVPHFFGMDAGWAKLTLDAPREWCTYYAEQKIQVVDRWIRNGRMRFSGPKLFSHKEGLRPLVKSLRDGASLCLLPDMDFGARDSIFVPFFGVKSATVTSLGRLSAISRVPVATWVCRIIPNGYQIEVGEIWPGYPSGNDEADAIRMNAELERHILSMPGQYHWLHRRFKTRPPGEPPLYDD